MTALDSPLPAARIIIPWRPAPSRIDAFERVIAWYRETLPQIPLQTVDTGEVPFVLAACRNAGMAGADPDEVVVVGDADTMGEDESVGSGGEELTEPKRKCANWGSGRACFRQATVDEVIWFPLDNAPELMQELAHESGARWAVHGTPAGAPAGDSRGGARRRPWL